MDIEILEMTDTKARFILKNSSPAMANALRRTLLTDIPKMAIDEVEIYLGSLEFDEKEYESTTPLFDEVIAHRLGMIPVPTDLDLFVPREQCSCGGAGCPNCMIMYKLEKHGPAMVLSGDLEPLGGPDSSKFKVIDPNIPIVELTKSQGVNMYARAYMGTAKKHVKWQVANGAGYKYRPIIKIDKDISSEDSARIVEICPRKVFELDGKKLVLNDPDRCSLCMTCCEGQDGSRSITVEGDDKNFVFQFETDGSLTAQQTLDKALEILTQEAKDFKAQIEAL